MNTEHAKDGKAAAGPKSNGDEATKKNESSKAMPNLGHKSANDDDGERKVHNDNPKDQSGKHRPDGPASNASHR